MQQRFCWEYVSDPKFNATQAAIRAGASEKSAHVKASQWLDKPEIQREIERLSKRVMYMLGITALSVAREVKKIADANPCDYGRINENGQFIVDLTTTTREQMAAVQEIVTDESVSGEGENKVIHRRTRLKLQPKLQANEFLGRSTNAFPSRHEHTGAGGGPIHFTLERIGIGKKAGNGPAQASA